MPGVAVVGGQIIDDIGRLYFKNNGNL